MQTRAEHSRSHPVTPEKVEDILSRHLLTKGVMPMVLDMEASRGVQLRDARSGRTFIDFFGFYASSPLGMNHAKMRSDEAFLERLMDAAVNKITNSDIHTGYLARFVDTFSRVGIPDYLPYAFFISGGALAVENALKAAFDWKVRKNYRKGYRREVGHQVLHLDQAFHGRTGYTLSLTNTADPRKTMHYPMFDWPRIESPSLRFPITEHELDRVQKAEDRAIGQAKRYFYDRRDQIAAIIVEPIQGEGGDNHFRPEFFRRLQELGRENDALLIFDEVQSGVGITGEFWAHEALQVEPDIIAFGKKSQVCGMLASRRLDEVDDHVFQVPGRINSTWGGNLVDMVRFDRILEIIEEERLVQHAGSVGEFLLDELEAIQEEIEPVTNVRGRGLMCAFDLPSAQVRDAALSEAFKEGVILLGCGERSVRFRPPLNITRDEINSGLGMLRRALQSDFDLT